MRIVYKMTFGFSAFGAKWRKRTTVLAGHVDSADVWALDTMRCRGRERCSFTCDKHMQLVGYDSSHPKRPPTAANELGCTHSIKAVTPSSQLADVEPHFELLTNGVERLAILEHVLQFAFV